jgi:hypothetical protein
MTEVNFTECERIEILRRRDEMNSLIGLVPGLFYQEDEVNALRIRIKKETYWCWAFICAGSLFDWFLRKESSGFEINMGSFIVLVASATLIFDSLALNRNTRDLQVNYDKMGELLQRWEAATGSKYYHHDLYKFRTRFYRDGSIDSYGEDYMEWWGKQYRNIVFRVEDARHQPRV